MGSHQQKLREVLKADGWLSGRLDAGAQLRPWSIRTVFAMAEEHGPLDRPARFLTLWTTFGGMPDQWERFVTRDRFAKLWDIDTWPDDGREWRLTFIRAQREWLEENPDDRFDSRAFTDLAPPHRDALLWLAGNSQQGKRTHRFPRELKKRNSPELDDFLSMPVTHLGLVPDCGSFQIMGNGSAGKSVIQ